MSTSNAHQPSRLEKVLSVLPGTLIWLLFVVMAALSAWRPAWVAYGLLFYALYWVVRSFLHLYRIMVVFFHVLKDTQTDWFKRCQALDASPQARQVALQQSLDNWWSRHGKRWLGLPRRWWVSKAWTMLRLYMADQETLRAYWRIRDEQHYLARYMQVSDQDRPRAEQIRHVVIIPTYKEGMGILTPTLEALTESAFPLERVHVIIAGEAADEGFAETRAAIEAEFGERLPNLYFAQHELAVGELAGKSSNQASAMRWFEREHLPALGIQPEHLLVTSLDADYRAHPEYFAYLTYRYVVDPERAVHLFQPIPMFYNNIWQVNAFSRMRATMDTQNQMARQLDYRENRNFSSYALSLASLRRAGYWDVDVIQEDSRLFWKVFFSHGSRVRVEPLFLPVYGDAVKSATYWKSLVSLYEQLRRWAWGASDVPYVIVRCFRHPEIPWRFRLRAMVDVAMNYFNWATMPVILAVGTLFPLYFSPDFSQTVIGYNLPVFTSRLLTVTSLAVVLFLVIDAMLAPAKPAHWSRWRKQSAYIYWLSLPVFGIIFSALPAVDAQTRLMMGKQLQYKVTEKEV